MTPEVKATEAPRGRTRGQMGRCVFGTIPAEPSKCILPTAMHEYLHIYVYIYIQTQCSIFGVKSKPPPNTKKKSQFHQKRHVAYQSSRDTSYTVWMVSRCFNFHIVSSCDHLVFDTCWSSPGHPAMPGRALRRCFSSVREHCLVNVPVDF